MSTCKLLERISKVLKKINLYISFLYINLSRTRYVKDGHSCYDKNSYYTVVYTNKHFYICRDTEIERDISCLLCK